MKALRINASGYRTFDDLDVEIPAGCVAIVGGNGAGKSSFLNAIDIALFAGRGELADLLMRGQDELALSLEFAHASETYRVRRMYSAKGRGKSLLDFEKATPDGGWEPLTRESSTETQKLLEQTLGLSRATFRASSFLAQGDSAAFTKADAVRRKAILMEAVGLEVWDRLLERARGELRGCESDLLKTEGLIAGLDNVAAGKEQTLNEISVARASRDQTATAVAEADAQLEQAQEALTKATAAGENVRACEVEHQAAVEAQSRARVAYATAVAAQQQIGDKSIELDELAADAAAVAELEERLGELLAAAAAAAETRQRRQDLVRHLEERETARDRMVDRSLQLHTTAGELRGKADHLDAHIGDSALCDRCQQILGAEAALRAAASYRAEATGLDEEAAQLDATCERELEFIAEQHEQLAAIETPVLEDHAPVEGQLRAARAAGEAHVRLTEQVRQLSEVASHRERLEGELADAIRQVDGKARLVDAAKAAAGDVDAVQATVTRWRTAMQDRRRMLDERNAQLTRAEQQLERIVDAEQQLAEHHKATVLIRGRVDVLKLAEKAYGRDGIPALILESSVIPTLELEANRILGELGGETADCRIELRTQRELKTSDNLRETLDIVIRTPTGDAPYESFSGGEQTRLDLALRIALAVFLATRSGAESKVLCIDELDGLDAAGMDHLIGVLQGLDHVFDTVLIVSHQPQLASAFDQSIEFENVNGRSQIAGDREQVTV